MEDEVRKESEEMFPQVEAIKDYFDEYAYALINEFFWRFFSKIMKL